MITKVNNLLFDNDYQLDKLRIFIDELEDSLNDFTSKKMVVYLAEKFNINELDQLLISKNYSITLIQDKIGFRNRNEIIKLLEEFNKNKQDIIEEFINSNYCKAIKDKWTEYINIDNNFLYFNDAWGQIAKRPLTIGVWRYYIDVCEYFNIEFEDIYYLKH